MRVKAFINWKGKFSLVYIGRVGKNGFFKFRNRQLKKACLNTLREVFKHECPGGSLTIPNLNRKSVKYNLLQDGYVIVYNSVIPEKEDSKKYIVTYRK